MSDPEKTIIITSNDHKSIDKKLIDVLALARSRGESDIVDLIHDIRIDLVGLKVDLSRIGMAVRKRKARKR